MSLTHDTPDVDAASHLHERDREILDRQEGGQVYPTKTGIAAAHLQYTLAALETGAVDEAKVRVRRALAMLAYHPVSVAFNDFTGRWDVTVDGYHIASHDTEAEAEAEAERRS